VSATATPVRRAVAILALASASLALAPPAHAGQEKLFFEYGVDRRSWWWEKQTDQEVTVPVPPGAPVEPSQRVRLPSPQRPDTLPVAVAQGEHERMAALFFDLVARGVTDGSTITSFGFTIEESTDKNEQPSFKPAEATIQACRILEFWPDSDGNEEWKTIPRYSGTQCVEGTRDAKGSVPEWSFDATTIVKPWGAQPSQNFGVLLLADLKGATEDTTWQVNLKIPSRDDAKTAEANEYQKTKTRVIVDMAYVPGEPASGGSLDPGGSLTYGSSSGSSFSSSFGSGGSAGFSGGSPVTSSGAGTEDTASETSADPAPAAASRPAPPRLPAYVWTLVPLGLLALAAVRSVVLEPAGGPRPDGVIEAIRRRNLERRGAPLRELSDPFTRLVAAGRIGLDRARRGFTAVRRGAAGITKRIRKR
jgi:hypothetical protein